MSFSIDLITEAGAFEKLKSAWNELVDSMAFPEIFYSWEWNFHFRQNFRTGDDLFILLVRDGSRKIVGIAPFCIRRTRRMGLVVKLMTPIVDDMSDYQNIMIRDGVHRGRVVSAILEFLRTRSDAWDVIDFSDLCSRDATTLHLLNLAPPYPNWSVRTHVSTPVAVRDLKSPPIAENRNQIRQIRNRLKTLQAQGLRIQVGCEDVEAYWPAFCELHRKAWPSGPFHDAAKQKFYDDLKSSAGLKGKIEISIAEFEGRPAAMHFGFVDARKVYYYMPAMDHAFHKERIGSVLLYAMIEHYQKTHAVFDFLRGLEPYKLWYTDELDLNLRLVVYRSTSLAAFAYNLGGVTRRYGVELGLPKAAAQLAKAWMRRFRPVR